MGGGLHPDPRVRGLMKAQALVVMGPPGAGKGTQVREISRELGIPAISTGEILRDAVEKKLPVGLAAQATMESGGLVPDELVCSLVEGRIAQPDCGSGFIADGFPRSLIQAEFLDALLLRKGIGRVAALNIVVQPTALLKRLSGRRMCPRCGAIYNVFLNPPQQEGVCDRDGGLLVQRKDDGESVILNRLREYERQTEPLIEYYRRSGLLQEVDGNRGPGEVTAAILRILKDP